MAITLNTALGLYLPSSRLLKTNYVGPKQPVRPTKVGRGSTTVRSVKSYTKKTKPMTAVQRARLAFLDDRAACVAEYTMEEDNMTFFIISSTDVVVWEYTEKRITRTDGTGKDTVYLR